MTVSNRIEDTDWMHVCHLDDIPPQGARVLRTSRMDIAVFRTALDEVFALQDRCPHKGGPLSQGIVHGQSVTCPLHNWVINLAKGEAQGEDQGCALTFPSAIKDGAVYVCVPVAETLTEGEAA